MKKLKKINLNKSFEDFTPLKEWELRTIVAGDGDPSWDCLFNAFIYTYEELYGITLNKDEMVQFCYSVSSQSKRLWKKPI